MPFKSQAQREWMWANHPDMAREWENATPKGKKLPEHVKAEAVGITDENFDREIERRFQKKMSFMDPKRAIEPSEVDQQLHPVIPPDGGPSVLTDDHADVTHPGFHEEPGYHPERNRPVDPFYERYPQDEPYFNVGATDPMRLEIMKDLGMDGNLRNPVAGSMRLVFDPRTREKTAVKVKAPYVDAFDGTAEDGQGLRAVWSPGENTWVRHYGQESGSDWAPTVSHDWS